jgi:hypothetical protein
MSINRAEATEDFTAADLTFYLEGSNEQKTFDDFGPLNPRPSGARVARRDRFFQARGASRYARKDAVGGAIANGF